MRLQKTILVLLMTLFSVFMLVSCGSNNKEEKNLNLNSSLNNDSNNTNTQKNDYTSLRDLRDLDKYRSSIITNKLRTQPTLMVGYIEVNDISPLYGLKYWYAKQNRPFFDVITMFAANWNYDGKNDLARLYFNDNWAAIFKDYDKYVKPLRDAGIVVLMDILPNHQGVGYSNLNERDIDFFIKTMQKLFARTPIDGIDMDNEYAVYGKIPNRKTGGKRDNVFMRKYKEAFPDKVLSVYNFESQIDFENDDIGKYVDMGFGPFYTTKNTNPYWKNFPSERYASRPKSGVINRSKATDLVRQFNEGDMVNMIFNLRGDSLEGLEYYANKIYNDSVVDKYPGNNFEKDYVVNGGEFA